MGIVSGQRARSTLGVLVALTAGIGFSTGGVIAKPLFSEGWSPPAAVLARIGIAVVVLAPFALRALRRHYRQLWEARWAIVAYGVLAVVGTQVGFYSALERIPVSIALLVQYLAPVALLLFVWARTRRRPHRIVLAGAGLAIAGLIFVIGPTSSLTLDPVGLVFASVAMVGLAVYYGIGDRPDDGVAPIAFVWVGLVLGGTTIAIAGAVRILPVTASFGTVDFFGGRAPWWAPVLFIGLFSTAYAYAAGIYAITLLGARVSSFLGLTEVVFAGIAGWLLLGEAVTPAALIGAAFILGGIVLVRLDPSAVRDNETGLEPLPIPHVTADHLPESSMHRPPA